MSCLEEPHVIGLSDSGQLVGIVSKPGNGRYPAVVMLHGFTGHHIESSRLYVDLSRTICDNGFLTARFDYRGHGNSSGSFEDFDVDNALADAEAIMRYVMGLNNVDPTKMAMVGLSLGGFIAVKTYVKFKETIKALVLLAPSIKSVGNFNC